MSSGFLQDFGVLPHEIQQSEGGARGFPASLLPTDCRHLGDIEQLDKHSLADSQLFANRDDFLRLNWLDGPRQCQGLGAERNLLFAGGVAGQSFDAAHQIFRVEFDLYAFHNLA